MGKQRAAITCLSWTMRRPVRPCPRRNSALEASCSLCMYPCSFALNNRSILLIVYVSFLLICTQQQKHPAHCVCMYPFCSFALNNRSILLIVYVSFLLICTQQQKHPAHCVCILLAHLHSTTEASCSLCMYPSCSFILNNRSILLIVCVSFLLIYTQQQKHPAHCVCILLAHLQSTTEASCSLCVYPSCSFTLNNRSILLIVCVSFLLIYNQQQKHPAHYVCILLAHLHSTTEASCSLCVYPSCSFTLNNRSILLIVCVSFLLIYTQQQKHPAHCVCILLAHLHSTTEASCSLCMYPSCSFALNNRSILLIVCVSFLLICTQQQKHPAHCVCILAHLHSTTEASCSLCVYPSCSFTLNNRSILLIVYVSFLLIYNQQQKHPAHCVCILLAHLHSTTEASCSLCVYPSCSFTLNNRSILLIVCVSFLLIYTQQQKHPAHCVCILLAHLHSTTEASCSLCMYPSCSFTLNNRSILLIVYVSYLLIST